MEGLYPIIRRKRRPLGNAEVGMRNAESGGQMPEAGCLMPEVVAVPAVVEAKPGKRRKGARNDAAA